MSSSPSGENHINNTNKAVTLVISEVDLSPLVTELSDQPKKLEKVIQSVFAIQNKFNTQSTNLLKEIMEKKEKEKLEIVEKKEGEKFKINDDLRKVENTLKERTQALLHSRRI